MNKKDLNYVLDSLSVATYNALDDLGLKSIDAQRVIEYVCFDTDLIGHIRVAMSDYCRKVKICGGPKPRTVEV